MRAVKERMNLYITKSLMDDLRKAVPVRERTRFVEDILGRELKRRKLKEALKASAGAWKDEDHPDMKTGKDIDRWLKKVRKGLHRDFSKDWGRKE